MTIPIFPVSLAQLQDSKHFGLGIEDKTLKGEVDGGYTHARPRHTRKPRRTFKTGYTEITQSEFEELLGFYDEVGGYTKFSYTDPTTGIVYVVRFGKPFTPKYTGIGPTKLWTITDIELAEV